MKIVKKEIRHKAQQDLLMLKLRLDHKQKQKCNAYIVCRYILENNPELFENVNIQIEDLGIIRSIQITDHHYPYIRFAVEQEHTPRFNRSHGYRKKFKREPRKELAVISIGQLRDKTVIKIVNVMFRMFQKQHKSFFNRLTTHFVFQHFNCLLSSIYDKEFIQEKSRERLILWKVWLDAAQDNHNLCQDKNYVIGLIDKMETLTSRLLSERIRTIGYVSHVYMKDGIPMVAIIDDKKKIIDLDVMEDLTAEQRLLLITRMARRYFKQYKGIFNRLDEFPFLREVVNDFNESINPPML